MKFISILATCVALASAGPLVRRQVFSVTSYDDLSISGGSAGNAEQEALDILGGLPDDLSTVTEEDIDFLNNVNSICNEAEKGAFNVAIEAADGEEAAALERGKTKNKVLKLTATKLKLLAQEAQGEDVAEKLATEEVKLQNNINKDVEEAGQPSTFLSFDANTA